MSVGDDKVFTDVFEQFRKSFWRGDDPFGEQDVASVIIVDDVSLYVSSAAIRRRVIVADEANRRCIRVFDISF